MKYILLVVISVLLLSCGEALELQKFEGASQKDYGNQQDIAVDIKPLTFKEIRFLNSQPFERQIKKYPNVSESGSVADKAIIGAHPPAGEPVPYRIGAGDVLSLELVGAKAVQPTGVNALKDGEVDLTNFGYTQAEPAILSSPSQVSLDGSVLFLETGRVKLKGLTLQEAEGVIRDALVRNNVDPLFQLNVVEFASQYVSVVGNAVAKSMLVPLTTRQFTISELLSSVGVGFQDDKLVMVYLTRGSQTYSASLEHFFAAGSPSYYLRSGDVIKIESLSYAPDKAYLTVSTGTPVAFPLEPGVRTSLADMLFVPQGPLSNRRARLSEIYLLRGKNPISAYHLDAEEVSRLAVAREVELRPGDIVFVSDKPVYTALELLSVINPFRAFYESFQ